MNIRPVSSIRLAPLAAALVALMGVNSALAVTATERQTLVDLYTSTGGANWNAGAAGSGAGAWLDVAGTECDWEGVSCDDTGVVQLRLPGHNLVGALPALSGLSHLNYFDVSDNELTGPLPSDIGALTRLTTISASNNHLTGAIPSLARLTALAEIELADNRLGGPLPAFANLIHLSNIELDNNAIGGPIPDLTHTPQLTEFNVEHNALTGPMPSLAGLTHLIRFKVAFNQLSGPIPAPPPSTLGECSTSAAGCEDSSLCPNNIRPPYVASERWNEAVNGDSQSWWLDSNELTLDLCDLLFRYDFDGDGL